MMPGPDQGARFHALRTVGKRRPGAEKTGPAAWLARQRASGPPATALAPERRVPVLAAEKHPIGRIGRLVDPVVTEASEEAAEVGVIRGRHLHSDQHPPVVGAMIAVMK